MGRYTGQAIKEIAQVEGRYFRKVVYLYWAGIQLTLHLECIPLSIDFIIKRFSRPRVCKYADSFPKEIVITCHAAVSSFMLLSSIITI